MQIYIYTYTVIYIYTTPTVIDWYGVDFMGYFKNTCTGRINITIQFVTF